MYKMLLKNSLFLLLAVLFLVYIGAKFLQNKILFVCFVILTSVFMCIMFSLKITKKISDSVDKIDLKSGDLKNIYKELLPFSKKITMQSDEILAKLSDLEKQNLALKSISESMSEGLVILDKNRKVISANENILKIFSGAKEAITNDELCEALLGSEILKTINKAYRGSSSSVVFQVSSKSYRIFCSPVFSEDVTDGVILLFFDISNDVQSAKIRREFSANVSHELKTPLTSILGYSQIINGGIAKENDILKFTQKIEKEASRLISLINDIIELSKLDEDKVPRQKENILLLPLIEEIAESLESKAREKEVLISTDGDNSVIFGNKAQISELLYNLLENSIKYNKQNGEVKVTVFNKVLTVSDTGIGIPEKYLDRVFERFFRVDKSHSKQVSGTGLGLSIVKHIAIQNNAEVFVESVEGKGSTFKVEF